MTDPRRTNDNSVQFSLASLMQLEDERVEEQERERAAREARERTERQAEEQRRAAETAAKERATAEAKERARKAELDELARREAMQKAVIEQARLEVEVKARAMERERERRHEIELATARAAQPHEREPSGGVARLFGSSLAGAAAMMAVLLGVHFGIAKPAAERHDALVQQQITAADVRIEQGSAREAEQRQKIRELETQLADARKERDAVKSATPPAPTTRGGGVHRPPVSATPPQTRQPETPCIKGDPMCFSVK